MRKDGDILQQFKGISNLARLKIMSTATVLASHCNSRTEEFAFDAKIIYSHGSI